MSRNILDHTPEMNFGFDKDQIIIYKLGQIESKLDAVLASSGDHEKRLKLLENHQARAVGALAIITLLFNGVVTFLKSKGII